MTNQHTLNQRNTDVHRSISPQYNISCRYITEHRQRVDVTTGYLEGTEYINPFHLLHVVPGNIENRIAVNESSTTKSFNTPYK